MTEKLTQDEIKKLKSLLTKFDLADKLPEEIEKELEEDDELCPNCKQPVHPCIPCDEALAFAGKGRYYPKNMSVKTIEKWTCDLCGESASSEDMPLLDKWIKIDIENKYLDRDWFTKAICPDCLKDIEEAKARKNKKH